MFQRLRDAFREAVENFHEELGRDAPSGTTDRLLSGMRREVAGAEDYLRRLEAEIREAEAEADREAAEVATCRRRETMARKIADEETARIAADFAARHERREQVLRTKARALRQELEIRTEEADEMRGALREAAELRGRTEESRSRSSGSPRLDRDLDEVRERISRMDARREVDDLLRDFDPPPRREPEVDLEARLRELKRRMGEDDPAP
jgi:hypothetical protein